MSSDEDAEMHVVNIDVVQPRSIASSGTAANIAPSAAAAQATTLSSGEEYSSSSEFFPAGDGASSGDYSPKEKRKKRRKKRRDADDDDATFGSGGDTFSPDSSVTMTTTTPSPPYSPQQAMIPILHSLEHYRAAVRQEQPTVPLEVVPGCVVMTLLGTTRPPPDVTCFVCGAAECPYESNDGDDGDHGGQERDPMCSFFWPCQCGPAHRRCFLEFQCKTWTPSAFYNCATCMSPIRLERLRMAAAAVADDGRGERGQEQSDQKKKEKREKEKRKKKSRRDDGGDDGSDGGSPRGDKGRGKEKEPPPHRTGKYFDPDDLTDQAIRREFTKRAALFWAIMMFLIIGCVCIWAVICWAADPQKNIPIFFRMVSSSVAGGSPASDAIEAWRTDFKRPDTPTWPSYGGMGVLLTAVLVIVAALAEKGYEEYCSEEPLAHEHRIARQQTCCTSCDDSGCWLYCYLGGNTGSEDGCCGIVCHSMDKYCCRDCGDMDCSCCDTSSGQCCKDGMDDCGDCGPIVAIIFVVVVIAVILSAVFIVAYFAASRMREYHSAAMAAMKNRIELAHRKMVILGVGERIRPTNSV